MALARSVGLMVVKILLIEFRENWIQLYREKNQCSRTSALNKRLVGSNYKTPSKRSIKFSLSVSFSSFISFYLSSQSSSTTDSSEILLLLNGDLAVYMKYRRQPKDQMSHLLEQMGALLVSGADHYFKPVLPLITSDFSKSTATLKSMTVSLLSPF